MNPQNLPKGPSIESDGMSGQAKPANLPGVYRHPQAGKEVIVLPDPISRAQQDALVRLGFEWVGEAPSRVDLLKMQDAQAKKDAADEKKGITAPGSYEVNNDPNREVFNGTATDTDAELIAARAKVAALEADARERGVDPATIDPSNIRAAAATPAGLDTTEADQIAAEAQTKARIQNELNPDVNTDPLTEEEKAAQVPETTETTVTPEATETQTNETKES